MQFSVSTVYVLLVNLLFLCWLMAVMEAGPVGSPTRTARDLHKRSFTGLGCLGVYDKSKFARAERVCEECYQMYREPEVHNACRNDCFHNEIFSKCLDALLLSHEQEYFEEMVSDLYGRR